jgi:hypothetical protein
MTKQCSVKISVAGVGHLGSVVAFTLAIHGLADEIVLCARDGEDEAARASQQRLIPALDDDEKVLLQPSAATVRDAIRRTEHLCRGSRLAAAARKNGRGPGRGPVTEHV